MCDEIDDPWAEGKEDFPMRVLFYSGDQNVQQRKAEDIRWPASKTMPNLLKAQIADMCVDPKDFAFVLVAHDTFTRVYMYTKDKDWQIMAKLHGKLWLLGQVECIDYKIKQ